MFTITLYPITKKKLVAQSSSRLDLVADIIKKIKISTMKENLKCQAGAQGFRKN
jgi:hypothetical protein